MPREISGLRIARSYVTPAGAATVSRVMDFQLGARQGIAIHAILGDMLPDPAATLLSTGLVSEFTGVQTMHLESGSLETVPNAAGEDEDTIDSEVFFRQTLVWAGNDDVTTEFRASLTTHVTPGGIVNFERPILTARNISHRCISDNSGLAILAHVILYYVFVEFSLSELGLILARRT